MKKICWWTGTDALTLRVDPPGTFRWHLKLKLYRLKWQLFHRFFDEHWVNHSALIRYLKDFGCKNIKVMPDTPIKYPKLEKIKHDGFNVLYYCPDKPVNLGGMKFINWIYGYDIFEALQSYMTKVNFIRVNGTEDLTKIYPITDVLIRPTRHDGNPRMVREAIINEIPVYWSENRNPDITEIINFITKWKHFYFSH